MLANPKLGGENCTKSLPTLRIPIAKSYMGYKDEKTQSILRDTS
ncbi:MAG: hypothetical protein BAJATHORv1_20635 [Candidatus Thorarchaeota archaeon]|nr:MAG: hypothetical protein BAJATHORv1_20635 [Candidatus Thorarchaeota archaeon]